MSNSNVIGNETFRAIFAPGEGPSTLTYADHVLRSKKGNGKRKSKKSFNPSRVKIEEIYEAMQDIHTATLYAKELFIEHRRFIREEGKDVARMTNEKLRDFMHDEIAKYLKVLTYGYAHTKKILEMDIFAAADKKAIELKDGYSRKDIKYKEKRELYELDMLALHSDVDMSRNAVEAFFSLALTYADLYRQRTNHVKVCFADTDEFQREAKMLEGIEYLNTEVPYPEMTDFITEGEKYLKLIAGEEAEGEETNEHV